MCEKPSPRVLWSWGCLLILPLIAFTGGGIWLWWWRYPPFLPLWGILMGGLGLWCGTYLALRRRRLCYAVDGRYVTAMSGVFVTTRRCIPLEAVRQVTLLQGPIERLCRTAFILVNSTGGFLLIEGLDCARAEAWCRRLTADA